MELEQKPFTPYKLQEDRDKDQRQTFTVSINREERLRLDEDKKILQQTKDSTALKTLALIGRNVLHSDLTGKCLRAVLDNKRRNKRSNNVDFE